jgi:hypothetical protein
MTRTNYIFVDFENIQQIDLERLGNKPVKIKLVLGERHKSVPVAIARFLQEHPGQLQLIETLLNGKNALDFVLACEIGISSEKDPNGYFHVLSRDKGFDALIRHLDGKNIRAARHDAFNEIRILMNLAEQVKLLASYFKLNHAKCPKKRKALESHIQATFGNALLREEVSNLIQKLVAENTIAISDKGVITYKV